MSVCRIVIGLFMVVYGVALTLFTLGTFGLFGSEAVFWSGALVTPLGLPWNYLLQGLVTREADQLVLGLAAPAINVIIFGGLCALARR